MINLEVVKILESDVEYSEGSTYLPAITIVSMSASHPVLSACFIMVMFSNFDMKTWHINHKNADIDVGQ